MQTAPEVPEVPQEQWTALCVEGVEMDWQPQRTGAEEGPASGFTPELGGVRRCRGRGGEG